MLAVVIIWAPVPTENLAAQDHLVVELVLWGTWAAPPGRVRLFRARLLVTPATQPGFTSPSTHFNVLLHNNSTFLQQLPPFDTMSSATLTQTFNGVIFPIVATVLFVVVQYLVKRRCDNQ